jgi:hypothetical protein
MGAVRAAVAGILRRGAYCDVKNGGPVLGDKLRRQIAHLGRVHAPNAAILW